MAKNSYGGWRTPIIVLTSHKLYGIQKVYLGTPLQLPDGTVTVRE